MTNPFPPNPGQRARAKRIVEVVGRFLEPGAAIADLGTGNAYVPALLAQEGYLAIGVDDYGDPWHSSEVETALRSWAEEVGFRLVASPIEQFADSVDGVTLIDVIEHWHHSPRSLLNQVGTILKPGGIVAIMMPSAVNLRKRLEVLRGRTNYPPLEDMLWGGEPWRGHVREYTLGETERLLTLMGFSLLEANTMDAVAYQRLRGLPLQAYLSLARLWPGLRDTVIVVGKKPSGWQPIEAPEDWFTGPEH